MSVPKVTVLLPVWNAEKYIKQAIESVLNQTFKDFELLVIDDASTDKSAEIILSFQDARIIYVKNNSNLQLIRTLNKGIRLARGRYLARMDADDICFSERLEKQVEFLEKNKGIAVVGTDIEFISSKGRYIGKGIVHPNGPKHIKWGLQRRNCVYHPTVMVNMDLLGEDFFYDTNYVHAEDYELWLRLAKSYEIYNLSDILLKYRIHSASITNIHNQSAINSTLKALKTHSLFQLSDKFVEIIRYPNKISSQEDFIQLIELWKNNCLLFIEKERAVGKEKWVIQNNAISYIFVLSFFCLLKVKRVPIRIFILSLKQLGVNSYHVAYILKNYLKNFYNRYLLRKFVR